jgi:hypothetical protein
VHRMDRRGFLNKDCYSEQHSCNRIHHGCWRGLVVVVVNDRFMQELWYIVRAVWPMMSFDGQFSLALGLATLVSIRPNPPLRE